MKVVCITFKDKTNLLSMAEVFYRFTPQIAVSHEAIFLEIQQCSKIYTESEFLTHVESIFSSLECTPRMGIASTPSLALILAKIGTTDYSRVPIHYLPDFFNPFQKDMPKELGKMVAYLYDLKILTLDDFIHRIHPRDLSARFGRLGLMVYRYVHNDLEPVWPLFVLKEEVFEYKDFGVEFFLENLEPILFILKSHIDLLTLRLQSRCQSIKKIELRFNLERMPTAQEKEYKVVIEFALVQYSTRTMLSIIHEKIVHSLRLKPLDAPIVGLGTWVLETMPYIPSQKDLFFPRREENRDNFFDLVNRLAIKLGHQSVFGVEVQESYLPEKSWTKSKLDKGSHLSIKEDSKKDSPLSLRPLMVFKSPQSVASMGNHFIFNNKMYCIDNDFCEHVFSDWWDGFSERIYFRATTNLGPTLWVFQCTSGFFVHGVFD